MKQRSTLILKAEVIFIGLVVLALCVVILPYAMLSDSTGTFSPILLGMYITAIPFFIALYQALKLLTYIDKNKAFSQISVTTLKYIKYCTVTISAMYAAGMPYLFFVADKDDAPGIIVLGAVITFASFVIATVVAVLQKLLQNAVDIKSESDLTV